MSLAREKPFQHLTNEQVIQNAELMYYGGELEVSVALNSIKIFYFLLLLFSLTFPSFTASH